MILFHDPSGRIIFSILSIYASDICPPTVYHFP